MTSCERIQDELLVIRCKAGEPEAFDGLVERWQERLRRYAYNMVGEEDAAWDAVQETWVVVVNGIKRLGDHKSFTKWAYRVLSNKCADLIRTRQRQRRTETEAEDQTSPMGSDASDALNVALVRLPGEMRALLSLCYTDEYSVGEVAEILGIPEGHGEVEAA